MIVASARFGAIECAESDFLIFPAGLVGLTSFTRWVLLPSATNPDILWLQSADEPRFALAMLPADRLEIPYAPPLASDDRTALELPEGMEPEIFVILNRVEGRFHANLRGPVLVNPERMLARQAVLSGDFALRAPLTLGVVGEEDATSMVAPLE